MKIYLASQSPRRKELLRKAGIPFRVVKSNYKEKIYPRLSPSRTAMLNARGKARAARVPEGKGIVIGADTFIYLRGEIIGKPRNPAHARKMLKKLSGKEHAVYTGLALRDLKSGKIKTSYGKSIVAFKNLSEADIRSYVRRRKPLDKAGAYAVQEDGHKLIRSIRGSVSNVIGLPMELLIRELVRWAREIV